MFLLRYPCHTRIDAPRPVKISLFDGNALDVCALFHFATVPTLRQNFLQFWSFGLLVWVPLRSRSILELRSDNCSPKSGLTSATRRSRSPNFSTSFYPILLHSQFTPDSPFPRPTASAIASQLTLPRTATQTLKTSSPFSHDRLTNSTLYFPAPSFRTSLAFLPFIS